MLVELRLQILSQVGSAGNYEDYIWCGNETGYLPCILPEKYPNKTDY